MANKARYIGRYAYTEFGRYMVELEYEYRGQRYTVYENRSQGNEPLAWQHRNAQARIDSIIEMEERAAENVSQPSWQEAFEELIKYWNE